MKKAIKDEMYWTMSRTLDWINDEFNDEWPENRVISIHHFVELFMEAADIETEDEDFYLECEMHLSSSYRMTDIFVKAFDFDNELIGINIFSLARTDNYLFDENGIDGLQKEVIHYILHEK